MCFLWLASERNDVGNAEKVDMAEERSTRGRRKRAMIGWIYR